MKHWWRAAAMSLVFCLAVLGDSWGQSRPEPQPQIKTSPLGTQQRPEQPTPSPNFLTPEQIKKAITDGINTAAKEYEAHHPAPPPDNSGWWFNFLLVVFTGGLLVVGAAQGYLIFGTLGLARQEFISANRPRIILRDVYLIAGTIHYTLVNLGGTRATIIKSWVFAEFVEDGTRWRPLWPAADAEDIANSARLTFAGGQSKELQYALPDGISFAIKFPMTRRIGIDDKPAVHGEIYFVGALTYEDDLGMKRRSIFRRRWDDTSLTFVRLTPEQERDHEYAD
jgi:hypothetical protein